jgi:proline racemase
MVRLIKTIDAHVGGQALRLVVEGFPRPHGRTLSQQCDWLRRHADGLRNAILLPPRGHADLTAALFTEAVSPNAHAGLLPMDAAGYPSMSGHGVIAATTIAIERSLIFSRDFDQTEAALVLETPAGIVPARARLIARAAGQRVDAVAMTNVPSFVHAASEAVKVGARQLHVDIAFGGAFYAIVDTEATGIPLMLSRLPDLRRLGEDICSSLATSVVAQHPADPKLAGISGVIFTGPAQDPEAHLRNVTVSSSGSIDLSASAAGTSAVMAVLDAMGLLPDSEPFVHEGLSGSLLRGRVVGRSRVGETAALVTEIEGSAWITGEHTFCLDDDDPFREGILRTD